MRMEWVRSPVVIPRAYFEKQEKEEPKPAGTPAIKRLGVVIKAVWPKIKVPVLILAAGFVLCVIILVTYLVWLFLNFLY